VREGLRQGRCLRSTFAGFSAWSFRFGNQDLHGHSTITSLVRALARLPFAPPGLLQIFKFAGPTCVPSTSSGAGCGPHSIAASRLGSHFSPLAGKHQEILGLVKTGRIPPVNHLDSCSVTLACLRMKKGGLLRPPPRELMPRQLTRTTAPRLHRRLLAS
jgi:hypothetical protein